MNDPLRREVPEPSPVAPGNAPPTGEPAATDSAEVIAANKLTADEQMARFEQELKETDWGHQPC
jgi:hypothetical protein